MSDIKHPATQMVHCPSGPVPACDGHAKAIIGLLNMMGSHIISTVLTEPAECANCVNEGKASE